MVAIATHITVADLLNKLKSMLLPKIGPSPSNSNNLPELKLIPIKKLKSGHANHPVIAIPPYPLPEIL